MGQISRGEKMHRSIYSNRVLLWGVGVIAALTGRATAAMFSNSASIVIPGPGSSSGSSISVSGLGNSITSVSVEIESFTDADPNSVGLVVVGPTGAALALLGACGGSQGISPINVAFSDTASSIPLNNLVSGTFKPTQYASLGSFPSPGPGLAYNSPATFGSSTLASTFDGSNPNGTWSLYAIDSVSGSTGEISNGWNLQVNAVPEPASFSLIAVAGALLACRRRRHVRAIP
jgi:hypothetical protein